MINRIIHSLINIVVGVNLKKETEKELEKYRVGKSNEGVEDDD